MNEKKRLASMINYAKCSEIFDKGKFLKKITI